MILNNVVFKYYKVHNIIFITHICRWSAKAQCAFSVQQGVIPLTMWEPLLSNLW
jgi:hypothetical protein